jgi:hypothetical protein
MATIWKYPLTDHLFGPDGNVTGRPVIPMPGGAEILTVQMQDDEPTVWARVEPNRPLADRVLVIVGTGWEVPADAGRYIGTWQTTTGQFVFHLFESVTSA